MNIIVNIIMVFFGLILEVFWTGIISFLKGKNKKLIGHVSLLMVPLYFIIPFVYLLVLKLLPGYGIFLRALVYMVIFFILEYVYGLILKKLGLEAWNYSKKNKGGIGCYHKYNFQGLITLEYAPVWYVAGIIGEIVYTFAVGIL